MRTRDGRQLVRHPHAPHPAPGTIAPDLTLDSPPEGRTFRRRRLGLLTGVLAVTLAAGALVPDSGPGTSVVAAGDADGGLVIGESDGSVTLAAVFAETTDTLLAVTTTTLAGTTTTDAPTTTAPSATTTSTSTSSSTDTTTTSAPAAPADDEPSGEAAARTTPSTAVPTTAPPPTSPPATAPPATAAPATTAAPAPASTGGSGYSDPGTLQVWLDLARCESGGNWSIDSGNGYYGGLQFSLGTWQSVGGTGYPHEHSRDTQIEMGRRLQASAGWGAWPHCSKELGLR